MAEGITNIAGIEIPSSDPIFLAVVGVHVLLIGRIVGIKMQHTSELIAERAAIEMYQLREAASAPRCGPIVMTRHARRTSFAI